ncbi:MAG TPA: META domain-containing protein [Candidatus Limnocylindria bacterium]
MKRVLAVLVLGVALTACGGDGASSPTAATGLNATSWTLASMNERAPVGDSVPTLAFDDAGNVSGSAGCNTYSTPTEIEGNSIAFGPLATTQMACAGAAGVQERAFLQAMDEVRAYAMDTQGRLVLEDGVVLVFEPD